MPTLKTLLEQFVEEHRLGRLGTTTAAGDSTSVIDLTRFGGPTSGTEWPRSSPLRITSGDRIGQTSFVSEFDPATGDFTVFPALTGAPGSGANFIVVKRKFCDHIDRLIEALNRGLNRYCRRRMKVGLTWVPDGDLLGATVSTFWTGTNATPSYVDLAHPNGQYTRVLQALTSAADGFVESGDIPAHAGDTWDFVVWLRAGAASSTAEIVVRDAIAGADITLTFDKGAATTTSRSLVEVRGHFEVPAGCSLIRVRLVGQENPATVQSGPLIFAPRYTRLYTSQAHFQFPADAGEFFERSIGPEADEGPEMGAYEKRRLACDVDQVGWGLAFNFRETPPFPLYYEGLLGYADLSADTDSTHCPEDLALAAMALEFFETLADASRGDDNRSPFDVQARRARERWSEFERRFGAEPELAVSSEYQGRVRF